MTQADASGLGMNMVSQRTRRDAVESDAPHIRLNDDADLKGIYAFGKKLGQGSFGVVYEATHIKTQTRWAIKEVCRPEAGSSKVELLEQELKILRQVDHPHIIHLKESYETTKTTYLVTELCVGGELKKVLQKKIVFQEDEARHIICSLADAISYLHKRDIVHRDLKLENILVKNDSSDGQINIKVTDFGLSVMTGGVGIENMMTDACGTLIYMAPEMMSGRGYSRCCDVWSIGIIMYMLLCGEPPFVSKTKASLLEKIMRKEVKYTQGAWVRVSDAAKNVLTCLLRVDPAYRMSAKQLLENPWITGDTNMPAIPANVLDMMHHHQESEETNEKVIRQLHMTFDEVEFSTIVTKPLEDLSLTSPEDILDPFLLRNAALTEDDGCRSSSDLNRERDNICQPTTTTKQQDKRKNVPENQGLPQPSTTQVHVGVKPARLPSAKQRRAPDKRDVATVQKHASDLSKADDPGPSTSNKTKTASRKPPAGCKTTATNAE